MLFKRYNEILADAITDTSLIKGYGAGLMLPCIAYHLGKSFSVINQICDDDSTKQGISYRNLDVKVISTSSLQEEANVTSYIITSLENIPAIYKRLVDIGAAQIFIPCIEST